MAKCVVFGKKGIFLRVNQEGTCFACESKNSFSPLYRNNIQIEETDRNNPITSFNNEYYVYAWKIKDTGEIFYIGKGKGDRAHSKHDRAYEAEKIRAQYETVIEILKDNLSEEEALEYEFTEIKRILNETTHRLTNRIIPFDTKRDNGYGPALSTPPYKFETSPVLFASEIDEHYFKVQHKAFDEVELAMLQKVYFVEGSISQQEATIVYGGEFNKYLSDVQRWLKQINSTILKTRFAKSVTSWIYLSDDSVVNYEVNMKNAEERIGCKIPCYHLMDVWKYLKQLSLPSHEDLSYSFNSLRSSYNRIPIEKIKNLNDFDKAFDQGFPLFQKGQKLRKQGEIEQAIALYDRARALGYDAPALYNEYSKAFRSLKQYADEILILEEAILRSSQEDKKASWQLRLEKAKDLLNRSR